MTDQPGPGRRDAKFDRVGGPRPRAAGQRDQQGKEALYSTAPSATPSSQVLMVCERCDVESGRSVVQTARLLTPPFVWNPFSGKLWARCPACERRSWLRVRKGQVLRALLDRDVDR